MKKKLLKKTILSFIILVIISALCLNNCFAVEYDKAPNVNDIYLKQMVAIKKNTELINSFSYYNKKSAANDENNYPDNYGGSYIDASNNLVIKLTENNVESRKIVTEVIDGVIVEKCTYSYKELLNASSNIMANLEKYNENLNCSAISKDIKGCAIDNEENIIKVYVDNINEIKTSWFKNEIDDNPYIVFKEFEGSINEEILYSGQGIKTVNNNYSTLLSSAFRVSRTIDTGRKYGFLTCAHGLNVGDMIRDDDGNALGTVKLRKYGDSYDISYVELYNRSAYKNTITNSPYTLNATNDDLYHPVQNQFVYFYSRYDYDVFGKITSTNVSFNHNGTTFSGLIGADYPSRNGDSGGLVCSVPNNYSCNPVGIHKGTFGEYKVFTGAIKAVNLWYLNRY